MPTHAAHEKVLPCQCSSSLVSKNPEPSRRPRTALNAGGLDGTWAPSETRMFLPTLEYGVRASSWTGGANSFATSAACSVDQLGPSSPGYSWSGVGGWACDAARYQETRKPYAQFDAWMNDVEVAVRTELGLPRYAGWDRFSAMGDEVVRESIKSSPSRPDHWFRIGDDGVQMNWPTACRTWSRLCRSSSNSGGSRSRKLSSVRPRRTDARASSGIVIRSACRFGSEECPGQA